MAIVLLGIVRERRGQADPGWRAALGPLALLVDDEGVLGEGRRGCRGVAHIERLRERRHQRGDGVGVVSPFGRQFGHLGRGRRRRGGRTVLLGLPELLGSRDLANRECHHSETEKDRSHFDHSLASSEANASCSHRADRTLRTGASGGDCEAGWNCDRPPGDRVRIPMAPHATSMRLRPWLLPHCWRDERIAPQDGLDGRDQVIGRGPLEHESRDARFSHLCGDGRLVVNAEGDQTQSGKAAH